MSVEIAAVSYMLSSMASVGKILESIFKLREYKVIPSPQEFETIERESEIHAEQSPPNATSQIVLAQTLSVDIVDVIRGEIDKVKERLKETYKDPGLSSYDKQRQADISRREFCWNIHQIRDHNGGTLPDDLEKEWKSNLCDQYKFI